MNLVLGTISAYPADEAQRPHSVQRHFVKPGDERILRHILEQLDPQGAQLRLPARRDCAFKLKEEKPRRRSICCQTSGRRQCRGIRPGLSADGFGAQVDGLGLTAGCQRGAEQGSSDGKAEG